MPTPFYTNSRRHRETRSRPSGTLTKTPRPRMSSLCTSAASTQSLRIHSSSWTSTATNLWCSTSSFPTWRRRKRRRGVRVARILLSSSMTTERQEAAHVRATQRALDDACWGLLRSTGPCSTQKHDRNHTKRRLGVRRSDQQKRRVVLTISWYIHPTTPGQDLDCILHE